MINTEAIKVINHTPTPLWKMFGTLDYLAIILNIILIVTFLLIIIGYIDIDDFLPNYREEPAVLVSLLLVTFFTVFTWFSIIYPVLHTYLEEKNTITIQAELKQNDQKLKDIKTFYETQEKYKEQLKSRTKMFLSYNKNKPIVEMTTTSNDLKTQFLLYPTLSGYLDDELERLINLLEHPEKIN